MSSLIVVRRVHRTPSEHGQVCGAAYRYVDNENTRARERGLPPPFVGLNIGYEVWRNQRSQTPVCLTGSVSVDHTIWLFCFCYG